ncbi:MAG: sulfotransferase [Bacteroidetes bacterium]|nr:sulfotransferase [Bacteroidota bacterium]
MVLDYFDLVSDSTSIRPNFFILGGPKCGTTSIYSYLKRHKDIYLSYPKEPNFFNSDFSESYRLFRDEESYLDECFIGVKDEVVIGEASVWYLYSDVAIEHILSFNPDAKFLVSLRNPIDMAYSLHSQMLYGRNEEEEDFQAAWNLQEARSAGKSIPTYCREARMLQYRDACCLGIQLERAKSLIPDEKLKVVLFDELKSNPEKVYLDILNFLGLEDDGFRDFNRTNANKRNRSQTFGLILSRLGRLNVRPLKRALGIPEGKSLISYLRQKNSVTEKRVPLSEEFRKELIEIFLPEIEKLEALTGRILNQWKY